MIEMGPFEVFYSRAYRSLMLWDKFKSTVTRLVDDLQRDKTSIKY